MSDLLYPLRVVHGKLNMWIKKGRSSTRDPFRELEDKGLIIAESSKKIMHSPNGIDRLAPWLIEIGEDCMVSTNVQIMVHDASTAMVTDYTKYGRVKIGNRVFIGYATTILPGVSIGDDVIIASNSVVTKNLPANGVYGGNPARFICTTEEYRKKKLAEINVSPIFDKNWKYWQQDATAEERKEMTRALSITGVGYIKADR